MFRAVTQRPLAEREATIAEREATFAAASAAFRAGALPASYPSDGGDHGAYQRTRRECGARMNDGDHNDWIGEVVDRLASCAIGGYAADSPSATEPTALAAIALAGHGRTDAARRAARWLAEVQNDDGSLGVTEDQAEPRWPTSLAVLAWLAVGDASASAPNADDLDPTADDWQAHVARGAEWILHCESNAIPRSPLFGHDSMIVAWPWVVGTHAWVEPTALHVLALKATGHQYHSRTREGVRMLFDRQLPSGGWNYGNTVVMGQTLRPHVQPTGIALLALADEVDAHRQVNRSLDYLTSAITPATTTSSLAWALLGLAAYGALPPSAMTLLETAWHRTKRTAPSTHKLALLALAADVATRAIATRAGSVSDGPLPRSN